jgi:hypothetical protein
MSTNFGRSGRVGVAVAGALVGLTILVPPTFAAATHSAAQSGAAHRADQVVRTRASWNPHVSCRATLTSVVRVLGSRRNRNGGATYRGGHFKPGIPDRQALHPPCRRAGVPTFVQLNRVILGKCTKINQDGDWTCNLTDPTVPRGRTPDMSQIHVETDHKFRSRSGWSLPPGGTLINIQGFVFWDPGHVTAAWHHFSGWEIHSLTAWRHSPKRH